MKFCVGTPPPLTPPHTWERKLPRTKSSSPVRRGGRNGGMPLLHYWELLTRHAGGGA